MTELEPEPATDNPNERYSIGIDSWSSISDVDTFFSKFNHDNGYCYKETRLRLGDYVVIQDGTYNISWMIAGFDLEHNQTASDDTVYDNGYGICMIPNTYVTKACWDNSDIVTGGYISSTIHTSTLPTIVNKLKNVLGDHIVNRNVLLSSSINIGNGYSSMYTWTTAYATLMSVGQLTGDHNTRNKYDCGEANYKLPLFNYTGYSMNYNFWTRSIWGFSDSKHQAYVGSNVNSHTYGTLVSTSSLCVRPMIYLR